MAQKEVEDLDDDLYADIKLSSSQHPCESLFTVAPTTTSELPDPGITHKRPRGPSSSSSTTHHHHHHHPKSLTDQVVDLQQTVERLQAENEILKRNMGTLFRTATAELARKDRQLQQVQRQQLALADQS